METQLSSITSHLAQATRTNLPVIVLVILCLAIAKLVAYSVLAPWLRALRHDPSIRFIDAFGMRFRKVDPIRIAQARQILLEVGVDLPLNKIETHQLAGGDPLKVARAIAMAVRANLNLSWMLATTLNLAGRDVERIVELSAAPATSRFLRRTA